MPSTSLHAAEIAARMRRVEKLADTLDAGYRLPVLGIRFGWDSILGLIPGVGDVLSALPSLWILNEARRMGARRSTIARMAVNTGADALVGSVPLVGDIFDVAFKANRRNVALLREDVTKRTQPVSAATWSRYEPMLD